MFLRVTVLVFLFLARIHFPRTKSIAAVIRSRYSDKVLKMARKLEIKLDIKFLCKCENNDILPNFLCFRTVNKNLKNSSTFKQCQESLLLTEINMERSNLRILQKEFSFLHKQLQVVLNCIDFAHVLFFLVAITPL